MTRASQIVALAASDPGGALSWLDGGDGRGLVALEPDLEIAADDLAALSAVEALWRADPERVWIGWLTYDVGVDALLGRPPRADALPGLLLRRYRAALELGEERVLGDPRAGAALRERLDRAEGAGPSRPVLEDWPLEPVRAALSPDDYRARVRQAQEYIAAGETYQINLTQPFSAGWRPAWRGRPLAARAAQVYAGLRAGAPASMGALLAAETGRPCARWIASNSPETLLAVELGRGREGGDLARSSPIKGTRPRGADEAADARAREELLASVKDLAEHVMIVDLVRSDLGRLAAPGSVEAPERPELVTLPTVHHLVSEVRCTLRGGWSLAEVIAAVFPGGSITGAPKRRTAALIDALEARRRGIYCGAIVALTPEGLRCSIPIRTGVLDEAGLAVQTGGGIVIDSEPEAERAECWAKVRAFDRR